MKTQRLKSGLILSLLLLGGVLSINDLFAQDNDSIESVNEVKVVPFQLTLISPLGTNGINSGQVANNASINILAGISHGVKGAEIGGLANFSKGNISGFQGAGLLNGSMGSISGAQIAGLGNYNKELINGAQIAGLFGINTAAVKGAQLSGLVNYSMNHVVGVQATGLVNTNIGKVSGVQLAGLTSISTKSVNGVQLSGLVNTTVGTVSGLQMAGLVNVSTEKIDGAQIGLVNYSRNLKGFQLGLINVCDTVEKGAALGLITYVRHGYHKFEIEANETFYANATFKSGVRALYMIYTVGFKHENGVSYWAPGLGLGNITSISEKLDINTDLITRQVNEGEWWTEDLNLLNTLSINLAYNFTDRLAIYGGPSLNVTVSGIKDSEGNIVGDSFSPSWGFFDETYDNNRVRMYVGFKGGIRF